MRFNVASEKHFKCIRSCFVENYIFSKSFRAYNTILAETFWKDAIFNKIWSNFKIDFRKRFWQKLLTFCFGWKAQPEAAFLVKIWDPTKTSSMLFLFLLKALFAFWYKNLWENSLGKVLMFKDFDDSRDCILCICTSKET